MVSSSPSPRLMISTRVTESVVAKNKDLRAGLQTEFTASRRIARGSSTSSPPPWPSAWGRRPRRRVFGAPQEALALVEVRLCRRDQAAVHSPPLNDAKTSALRRANELRRLRTAATLLLPATQAATARERRGERQGEHGRGGPRDALRLALAVARRPSSAPRLRRRRRYLRPFPIRKKRRQTAASSAAQKAALPSSAEAGRHAFAHHEAPQRANKVQRRHAEASREIDGKE